MLEDFVEFLEQAGAERITIELAVVWAGCRRTRTRTDGASGSGWCAGSRATWRRSTPLARSRPDDLLPARLPRVAPYMYSEAEIAALMARRER